MLGRWLRDVIAANPASFRLFGPDETASNRLQDVFEVTDRQFEGEISPGDEHLALTGRVMEVLSEHLCQGWLEGYLLTGRHGLFNCYEAFIHIVDSMFNQHAKWLKVSRTIPWRRPIASLNYLLSSLVWRQDHNGFSHQDPGFIDHVVNKKAEIIRVYLPPDANCLLSVADHCLRSRNYVNVIVAGKQPQPDWLTMDDAVIHCTRGAGIWEWATNDDGGEPDVVMACAGDIPTLETLAAVALLREHLPELRVRVVNVVDLMRLEPETEHPHGMSDAEFDAVFTTGSAGDLRLPRLPVADPPAHLPAARPPNLHVRGYKEEGTTTTPFDMVMLNDLDRFHLVIDVIDRVPGLASRAGHVRQLMTDQRIRARAWTRAEGRGHSRGPGLEMAELADHARGLRAVSGAGDTLRILVVNAGSSSLKLRVLGDGDEMSRHGGPARPARHRRSGGHRNRPGVVRRRSTRSGTGSCTAAPSTGARADRRRRPAAAGGADRPGASAPAQVARRAGRGAGGASRRARRRLLRHRVSRHHPRRRPRRSPSRGMAAALGPCAATGSTDCRTPGSPAAPRNCLRPGTSRGGRGWSAATWARARRWPRSPVAGRWTPRWGSPRWTAW